MFPNRAYTAMPRRQQGFLIPLALFILVVMGVLALTISRTSVQTQTSSVQEMMNAQAFYAAESGAQRGMKHLYFDVRPPTRASVDLQCSGLNTTYSFTSDGLKVCTARVNCSNNPVSNRSIYTLTSIGSCGTGQYRAERTVEVGSFMEQE